MPNIRHILFPYDFSTQGRQTVPFVEALARCRGSLVTLLSIVPPVLDPVPFDMASRIRVGDDPADSRQTLQNQLDHALNYDFVGIDVGRVADSGDPASRIVDFAERHAVDLIMMPTHGLGLFRSLLVGSVTAKVLHDAKCPVWTAAHAETPSASERPRTIVCAVDGTATTIPLVQYASQLGATLGAKLSVLHVVGPVSDWPGLEIERRLQEQVREQAHAAMASMLRTAGVEAPFRIIVGGIVPTVTEDARQEKADLLIIGRGAISEPFGRLRTHAFGIIQRSPCPVLSL